MPSTCTWQSTPRNKGLITCPGKPIRKLPKEVTVALTSSGEELYNVIAQASGASIHRLRITKGSDRSVVPNAKNTTIKDTGLKESSVIHVKDLGTYLHRQFLRDGANTIEKREKKTSQPRSFEKHQTNVSILSMNRSPDRMAHRLHHRIPRTPPDPSPLPFPPPQPDLLQLRQAPPRALRPATPRLPSPDPALPEARV